MDNVNTLTRYSNLSQLTRADTNLAVLNGKVISKADLNNCVDEISVDIINENIQIEGPKGFKHSWNDVEKAVKILVNGKLTGNNKLRNTTFFSHKKDAFIEIIAKEIVAQLRSSYDSQDTLTWIAGNYVGDIFYYGERFGITDIPELRAEFIVVSAEGYMRCDQKILGNNEVYLNISLKINGILLSFENYENRALAQIFMENFVWKNVPHILKNC
uniref:Uncharacterized protein n=1 Tax=Panagrolaimus sp. JU765 TaxID=591449 RepID=A0AC34RN22_9BILA